MYLRSFLISIVLLAVCDRWSRAEGSTCGNAISYFHLSEALRHDLSQAARIADFEGVREVLAQILPHGWITSHDSKGRTVSLQFQSIALDASFPERHLQFFLYVPETLVEGTLGAPGRYAGSASLNLLVPHQNWQNFGMPRGRLASSHHFVSTQWRDGVLSIQIRRDRKGRFYDRGARWQMFEIQFSPQGRLLRMKIRNTPFRWWRGQELNFEFPDRTSVVRLAHMRYDSPFRPVRFTD